MAIKEKIGTVRDYTRYYRRRTTLLIVGLQAATLLIAGSSIILTGAISIASTSFWAAMAAATVVSIIGIRLILPPINRPVANILAAVSHKTKELTSTTPPNPNENDNQKTGLKAVLEAIYSTEAEATEDQEEPNTHDLLTEALNHTSCGVILLNSDKQIISANNAAPIGKSPDGTSFIALDFLDDIDIAAWLVECDKESINAERRWRRVPTSPDVIKKQKFFDIVASYEKGAETETVIVLVDQSEIYLPEEEDLNFIAFAAHELRGPITVIRGYLDIFGQELADRFQGDEAELFSRLSISANRLSSYINNILNVARFDRHHLKVHLHEDTVANIYATIADDMHLRAKAQHRLLSVSIPDNLPTVAADRSSIGEVMGNMIDNAIKYSYEGGVVTLSAQTKGDFVEVSIADRGVGMPASVVKNLFRKFYRSHRSREAIGGTGIGLYICKAFIESHGGSVSVRSRENEGSTFTFTLPVYSTVADKLLEDNQLNHGLIRQGSGWIKNHAMYRG